MWAPNFTRLEGGAGTTDPTLLQCGELRRQVACADVREERHVVCTTPGKRMQEEDTGREGEGGLKAEKPPFAANRPNIILSQTCLQWKTVDAIHIPNFQLISSNRLEARVPLFRYD